MIMGLTVYLAEKPNMGRIIANALSVGRDKPKSSSNRNAIVGEGWAVCWLAGHAYQLYDAKDYTDAWAKAWANLPLPLIPSEFKFKPIKGDFIEGCRKSASALIKKADKVVIATDAGQEGQIIAEIFLDQIGWQGETLRLWSSSANVSGIASAIDRIEANTKPKYQGLRKSGLARIVNDWLIGINFTVAYSNIAQRAGYDFLASAGRVQSCCLAIVVDHDAMVESFKSSSYCELRATFQSADGTQFFAQLEIPSYLTADNKYCRDKGALEKIIAECQQETPIVSSIIENTSKYAPPTPYNLTNLCVVLSREFNINAGEVMKLYQAMYESGWLTYTRTDDTYYEDEQLSQIGKIFSMLKQVEDDFVPLVEGADLTLRPKSFDSSKIEEHSANSPTQVKPKWESLDIKSKNIYRTVAKQLIAQFYPEYISNTSTANISVGKYNFLVKGMSVLQKGWTEVIPHKDKSDGQAIPNLKRGETLSIINMETIAKKTRAPARMTEAKLLSIMEDTSSYLASEQTKRKLGDNASLGTAATRPGIIELLVEKRKYLSRSANCTLTPTRQGKQVRALLPPELSTPDLSALWEINFHSIRKGTLDPDEFTNKVKQWVSKQIQAAKERKINPNPLSTPCPQCNGILSRRTNQKTKSNYWQCTDSSCRYTVQDYQGKPLEPLAGDGDPCPKCGKPFKTFVRNKNKMSLAEIRKTKDMRYMMCENRHFSS